MTDTGPISETPQVIDKRGKVPGVLPRNAQAWVLGGVAILMIAVILFSGKNPPSGGNPAAPRPASGLTETSQARIQEYRAQIDEQARRLMNEQEQLQKAKASLGVPASLVSQMPGTAYPSGSGAGACAPYVSQAAPMPGHSDSLEAPANRDRKGLFASNIALSFRRDAAPALPSPALGAASCPLMQPAAWAQPSARDLFTEARASARAAKSLVATTDDDSTATETPGRPEKTGPAIDPALTQAEGKSYRLFEGTIIETVLTNRLDGTFSGPVNCMVTTNVYSHDHQRLLIPQGTRVLGEVRKLASFGEQRLAVFFHRLIMPDGFSVSLDKFKGLSQVGETGLRDLVNHHYLQIFGVSLAIGAIAGLSQANTQYGIDVSALDAYRQAMAGSLSQTSLHILDRYLNVLPTFTIREGQRVKVYLSNDLALPAYDKHELASDL